MSILSENVESLLATLARLHAIDGQAREVAVLTEAQPTITVGEWVGSSHEIAALVLCLTIPIRLFSQLRADKEAIEKSILKNAAEVFSASEDEFIEQVIIIPAVSPGEDGWREKARAWTRGENISNQGRVRSDNVAPKECDGLLFRSEAEIELYKALKSLGVSFAPLPVFIRGGKEYRRIGHSKQ
jgi:hypothetical protein